MLKSKKIAITGSLGAGKTTACQFFEQLGACYISTDIIVHQLLSPKTETGQKVIVLFGNEVVVDGRIDRDKIAQRVFDNADLLDQLEEIIHPQVLKELERKYLEISKNQDSLFVAEVPLLFEAGFDKFFDKSIAIISDTRRESKKIMMTKERKARMLPQKIVMNRSDFVLENNGTIDELKQNVKTLYNQLIQQ